MSAVLDAGALIAIDRRDRRVGAMLRVLQRTNQTVCTSAGALAQVWRDGGHQANLARSLQGLDEAAIDEPAAKKIGALLRRAGSSDIVEAHVALLAHPGDQVLTGDQSDIEALLSVRRVAATIVAV